MLYLGTLTSLLPAAHPSLRRAAELIHGAHSPARSLPMAPLPPHPAPGRGAAQWSLALSRVSLPDEEPRAVVNMSPPPLVLSGHAASLTPY
jgi:hypothetical protein